MAKINAGRFFQISLVTKDIDRTVNSFQDVLGIGPWEYNLVERKTNAQGEASPFKVRLARTMGLGPILIEVVQVMEGEGVQTEWSKKHGEGIMDLTFRLHELDDLDKVQEQFEKVGWHKISGVRFPKGVGYSYFDTEKDLGCLIQVGKAPKYGWKGFSYTKPW